MIWSRKGFQKGKMDEKDNIKIFIAVKFDYSDNEI